MQVVKRLYSDVKPTLVLHLAARVGGIGANRDNSGSSSLRGRDRLARRAERAAPADARHLAGGARVRLKARIGFEEGLPEVVSWFEPNR
jgi:hypothetical protein